MCDIKERTMFSIYETRSDREKLLNNLLEQDPTLALIVAFIDFEWTVRRTILALGKSSTKVIRARYAGENPETGQKDCNRRAVCSLDGFNELWNQEVASGSARKFYDFFNNAVKLRNVPGFNKDLAAASGKKNRNTADYLKIVYERFRNTVSFPDIRSDKTTLF